MDEIVNTPLTQQLARYRFDWVVTRPIRLPDYAGSMLRGAFGHALRNIGCITREKDCTTCPLRRDCPYTLLFEPVPPAHHTLQDFSRIPVPYIIEPPEWGARVLHPGDTLSFHFTLIGRALQELPIAILAWRRALARGIGPDDGTAELTGIVLEQPETAIPIYSPENGQIKPHETRLACPPPPVGTIRLHITTPLRLQNNGIPLKAQTVTERALLMALVRRFALISEFHGETIWQPDFHHLGELTSSVTGKRQLSWRDWQRYSNRQKQKMTLGGLTGRWDLQGDLSAFWPALWFGQWLHAGKNASFGLGHYRIVTT